MFFEVVIPGEAGSGVDSTLQIEARDWKQALSTGLTHSQIPLDDMSGFYVDVSERHFKITDPNRRRTYRIRAIDDAERSNSQMLKALSGSHRTVTPPTEAAPPPKQRSAAQTGPVGITDKATGKFRAIGAADLSKIQHEGPQDAGRVLQETRNTGQMRVVQMDDLHPVDESVIEEQEEQISETALEDVFLEIQDIFEPGYAMEDAIDFVVDLAKKYIPSSHAGLLFAADTGDHLYFAAARGKGSDDLYECEVPIDRGIPAFTLRNGISLSINDPKTDSRYEDTIARRAKVEEKSIATAPIQAGERAFGVLFLLNREDRPRGYSQYDTNILTYIGSRMGEFIQQQLDAQPLE